MIQATKKFILAAVLLGAAAVGQAHADTCTGQNLLAAGAASCLASDVRAADAKTSSLYQSLQEQSPPEARGMVEESQAQFIKARDTQCLLDSRKLGHEAWLSAMEKSPNLMLCEMRYFRWRSAQLEKLLTALGAAQPGAASRVLTADALKFHSADQDYQLLSRNAHKHGRWYFEVTVNGAALSSQPGQESVAFQIMCGNAAARKGNGWLAYASAHDNHESAVYSIALDLDRGRIYAGKNGSWLTGTPGVSGGAKTIGGLYYLCGVVSMQRVEDLLTSKAVNVNFGDHPFVYDPPHDFQPFFSRPLWFNVDQPKLAVSIDYNAIDLGGTAPTLLVKNAFHEPQTTPGGVRFEVSYGQFEVDCGSMSMRQVLTGSARDPSDDYSFSADMAMGAPVTVASLGPNSFVGGAAKTACFLKQNGLSLPRPNLDGNWESMPSPYPTLRIFEAPDQRIYRNGYMLVKQKNDFVQDSPKFEGKQGTTHIGVSAFACAGHTGHQIFGAAFDGKGRLTGGGFYIDDDAWPQLPENRKRFADACQAYLSNRAAYERPRLAGVSPPKQAPRPEKLRQTEKIPRAASVPPRAHRVALRRSTMHDDLRYCLDKSTNEQIILCTEQAEKRGR